MEVVAWMMELSTESSQATSVRRLLQSLVHPLGVHLVNKLGQIPDVVSDFLQVHHVPLDAMAYKNNWSFVLGIVVSDDVSYTTSDIL